MSRDPGPGVEGLLAVDKPGGPGGPTSHDIVARVRSILKTKRVGHAGTLDPMASGLLPLVLGRATRLVRFLPHTPKHYTGTLRLGIRTTTDDVTGETLATCSTPLPDPASVLEAAATFVGTSRQVPPAVSARKVGGQRLYKLARQGVAVEAPAVSVEVWTFDLEPAGPPSEYAFHAVVSRGTYIRGLARDLGSLLGCGGTLASLRRTAIGPLSVAGALPFPVSGRGDAEAFRAAIVPLESMPLTPPAVRLGRDEDAADFLLGRRIRHPEVRGGTCRVLSPDGRLIGIAEAEEGLLQPRVVLG